MRFRRSLQLRTLLKRVVVGRSCSCKPQVGLKTKDICLVISFSFNKYLKDRHYAQTLIISCKEHTGDRKAIKLERQVH